VGIIFCIVLLTVRSGFEDLTYGLCIIISERVSLRNDYGNVLSFSSHLDRETVWILF
jgi:hypothetical protein